MARQCQQEKQDDNSNNHCNNYNDNTKQYQHQLDIIWLALSVRAVDLACFGAYNGHDSLAL